MYDERWVLPYIVLVVMFVMLVFKCAFPAKRHGMREETGEEEGGKRKRRKEG
jgi:hypothetical protein